MVYLDASMVFSLYCADANSLYAASLIAAARAPFILSTLCVFETVNAFNLSFFREEISEREALQARLKFEMNMASGAYLQRPFPETVFVRALSLSQVVTPSIGVRAVDLLHIAAAFELGARTLYTFDQRQRQAALATGMAVNPNPRLGSTQG
jgi:predicted nucleic acid-binding protein